MAHLADTPVLASERLVLRAPALKDWPGCAAFLADDRSRFVGGVLNEGRAWRMYCNVVGHWALRGYGLFAYCEPDTDRAIGLTGPWYPADWPELEIGWTVWRKEDEGKGLAFEAATRARAWIYGTLGVPTLVSYIDPTNDRSIALAERLGATRDDNAARPEPDDLVYRHPAPEALGR
ncbi:MAG: GNAT family N-acetyltransferase [Pseudomonadota bacterium]